MTLLVYIVEDIESRRWYSCGRASQIGASHRKNFDGFHEAMRVVDVVDGNGAVVVSRINKLPIHRGLANSQEKVLLRIGLNAVRCVNNNWIAHGGPQGGRSGESRSPITIVDEGNSCRQRTGLDDRGRTRGGNGKRSGTPAVKVTLFPLVICGAADICAKIAKVCAKIAKPVVASTRAKEVAMRCTARHGAVTVGQREQKSAQQQAKLAAPVAGANGMTVINSTLSGNSAVLADGRGWTATR